MITGEIAGKDTFMAASRKRLYGMCECGVRKLRTAKSCDACLLLDVKRNGPDRVLDVLGILGGVATTYAVAYELGLSYRQTLRLCQRVVKIGRAERLPNMDVQHRTYWKLVAVVTPPHTRP